jgi:uncharacterized membrane protein
VVVLDTVAMVAAIFVPAMAVVLAVITMLVGCFVQLKLVDLAVMAMVAVISALAVGIGNSEIYLYGFNKQIRPSCL